MRLDLFGSRAAALALGLALLSAAGCGGAGAPEEVGRTGGALYANQLPDWRRTVIFIYGQTQPGQDMFVRGGVDHGVARALLGVTCTNADGTPNYACAIPIRHRNLRNATTSPWKAGDAWLDWYGKEAGQNGTSHGIQAQGTAADWTTNLWPASWGAIRTTPADGYGLDPLNAFGAHYWAVDVDMDCSQAYRAADGTRWFELKSFISNGPGWEPDVKQAGTPYASINHMGKCGMVNVFQRGSASVQFLPVPGGAPLPDLPPSIAYCTPGSACEAAVTSAVTCPAGQACSATGPATVVRWTLNGVPFNGMTVYPDGASTSAGGLVTSVVAGPGSSVGPWFHAIPAAQAVVSAGAGVTLTSLSAYGSVPPVWGGYATLAYDGETVTGPHGRASVYRFHGYDPGMTDLAILDLAETIYGQEVALTGVTPPPYRAYFAPSELSGLVTPDGNLCWGDGNILINYSNPGWIAYQGGVRNVIAPEFAHEHAHTLFAAMARRPVGDTSCLNEGLADATGNFLGHVSDATFGEKRSPPYTMGESCAVRSEIHDVGDCVFWHLKHWAQPDGAASGPYWTAATFAGLFNPQRQLTFDSCAFASQASGDAWVVYLSDATGADMTSFVRAVGFPTSGSYAASRAAVAP